MDLTGWKRSVTAHGIEGCYGEWPSVLPAAVSLYTDGGLIASNPSSVGGTWAYVLVDSRHDHYIACAWGVLPADKHGPVTNNMTELYAMLRGIHALKAGPAVSIYTDSEVTLRRLQGTRPVEGLPEWLQAALAKCRAKTLALRPRFTLLAGHPTKEELAAGKRQDGRPVSQWNVFVDSLCSAEGERYVEYLEKQKEQQNARTPGVYA